MGDEPARLLDRRATVVVHVIGATLHPCGLGMGPMAGKQRVKAIATLGRLDEGKVHPGPARHLRNLVERKSFQFDLEKQAANIQGLVQGVFVPNNAVVPKRTLVPGLGDLAGMVADGGYLAYNAKAMADKLARVQDLQDMIVQPSLPAETRVLVERDLATAQTDLAASVATVTEHVVASNIDPASAAGVELTSQLSRSVTMIQSPEAKAQLDTRFTGMNTGPATGIGSVLIGNLRRVGGIGRLG